MSNPLDKLSKEDRDKLNSMGINDATECMTGWINPILILLNRIEKLEGRQS